MKEGNSKKVQDELIKRTEYSPEEDIYRQEKKVSLDADGNVASEDTLEDIDLDVPGSELDDAQEIIGAEDEENNYWSLGGDNHENLEENDG